MGVNTQEVIVMEVFIATANKMPEIGKGFDCYKIRSKDGKPYGRWVKTSAVKEIKPITETMVGIVTRNSIYVVDLGVRKE